MRKITDVLRLKAEGLSERKIAASLGIGHRGGGLFIFCMWPAWRRHWAMTAIAILGL